MRVQSPIGDKEIAWMFGNCFPNTLDTTVDFEVINGRLDTYVITSEITSPWHGYVAWIVPMTGK